MLYYCKLDCATENLLALPSRWCAWSGFSVSVQSSHELTDWWYCFVLLNNNGLLLCHCDLCPVLNYYHSVLRSTQSKVQTQSSLKFSGIRNCSRHLHLQLYILLNHQIVQKGGLTQQVELHGHRQVKYQILTIPSLAILAKVLRAKRALLSGLDPRDNFLQILICGSKPIQRRLFVSAVSIGV